jgi:hypothetical protein
MDAPTRRHRSSDKPVRKLRTIAPHQIDQRYLEVLKLLEPYRRFKFLTTPWAHFLSGINVEYSVLRKYLAYLRQAPNRYIRCPEQQLASPNTPYKTLVYELAPRGLGELINRGIVQKRHSLDPDAPPRNSNRHHAFALHRSNSYLHEVIVDLGYYAPLHHLVRSDPSLRLLDFPALLAHQNLPPITRAMSDPLLIQLKSDQLRFDGTPHLIIRMHNGVNFPLGIPGIQVDRGTERFAQIEKYLLHAIEFIDERHYERHWGFDNCVIPFCFTLEMRKARAMRFVCDVRGAHPFLLFKTIPDIGLLPHFPKPSDYDRKRQREIDKWTPPDNIHVFTNPWSRVGYDDFYFTSFDEKGPQ